MAGLTDEQFNKRLNVWKTSVDAVCNQNNRCGFCKDNFGRRTIIDGILFRSIFESKCYLILKELCSKYNLTLQLQQKYRKQSKHKCDFYIPELSLWIEVSLLNKYAPHQKTIQKKRRWVAQRKENFIFSSSEKHLIKAVTKFILR